MNGPRELPDESDEDYERFVAEMAKDCYCAPNYGVCAGVLAGGFCDALGVDQVEEAELEEEWDDGWNQI